MEARNGTALALSRATALVTRSWDATNYPTFFRREAHMPPDTPHKDARLGPK
jgi:hypothetical protein